MHRSRLAGFNIDCEGTDPERAAAFWSIALGMDSLGADGESYVPLDAKARDLVVEVQRVSHASRVHLDIEADDVEAEVKRLQQIGARPIERIRTWWVMEAPTGQRFCVVQAKSDLSTKAGTRVWK